MKELPKIYKSEKVKSPNKEVYYSYEKEKNIIEDKKDIIFNDIVIIKTIDNNVYETKIVSKLNDHITTSNKDIIYLKDIEYIKRKDHI